MRASWLLSPRRGRPRSWTGLLVLLVLVVLAIVRALPRGGTDRSAGGDGAPPVSTAPPELPTGEIPVRTRDVVDGDTLRLGSLGLVRVLGLDTEEVFRDEGDRDAAERDFEAYARRQRRRSASAKYATPAGEAAHAAARRIVGRATRLRLEADHPLAPTRDPFGRILAHVVLLGEKEEILLAEAMIRAGHSPYFVKYGRSVRYDERLARAEAEARAARRGIWSTDGPGRYADYPERLAWWHARADQVDRWRARPRAPDRVMLELRDAQERLRGLVGRTATVFGALGDRKEEGSPRILWLRHQPKRDFAIVIFDDDVWHALDHRTLASRFLTVTGTVSLHRGRPQIVVRRPEQISTD